MQRSRDSDIHCSQNLQKHENKCEIQRHGQTYKFRREACAKSWKIHFIFFSHSRRKLARRKQSQRNLHKRYYLKRSDIHNKKIHEGAMDSSAVNRIQYFKPRDARVHVAVDTAQNESFDNRRNFFWKDDAS